MAQDVSKHRSPQFTQPFNFVPVDLYNEMEIKTLLMQREICGWNKEMEDIERWRDQIARDVKWMWWITLPPAQTPNTNSNIPGNEDKSNDHTAEKVGHVALAAECYPPEISLANPDHSTLTVSSFFILPQYRASGLGRACFYEIENKAREIPNCRQIAVDTIDRRHIFDPAPEWQGLLAQDGQSIKPGRMVNEDWYARMGYEKFKTAPRYTVHGSEEKLVAVFMRKRIR